MQLVLEAAKDIGNNYSVIVNKASEGEMEAVEDDWLSFVAILNEDLPGTQSVFFNASDDKIRDKKNQVPVLSTNYLWHFKKRKLKNMKILFEIYTS